jgi:hypothetical protein
MSLWRRVYSERKGVVLPLLLFLAANVAVLVLAVWPLRQSVARANDDAFDAVAGLGVARQMDTQARTAEGRMAGANGELRQFYTEVLPVNLNAALNVLVYEVPAIAASHGVAFSGSTSDYEEVRESRLTKVSNTAILRGQYQSILRFLHALETAEEFVIIERVELAQSTVTQQSAGGELELLVDVATYFLPASASGAGSAGAPTANPGGAEWP